MLYRNRDRLLEDIAYYFDFGQGIIIEEVE